MITLGKNLSQRKQILDDPKCLQFELSTDNHYLMFWITAFPPSSSRALHQLCAPDPLLTALRTAAFLCPHGSPLHTHLLLAPFLTHPPSTLSCAEKGISPLGSHFLLLTSLKDHLFLSRAQIFTESLNCDWSLLGW